MHFVTTYGGFEPKIAFPDSQLAFNSSPRAIGHPVQGQGCNGQDIGFVSLNGMDLPVIH